MARDPEGPKPDRGVFSFVAPDLAALNRSLESVWKVRAELKRSLEWIGEFQAPFATLQEALQGRLPGAPEGPARAEARRRDAIARAEASPPPPGRSFLEVLVDERTPPAVQEWLKVELAKRWSTDGGITAARCTRTDLERRVRLYSKLREKALTPAPVWLGGQRRRDVTRAADLPPDDLWKWWIQEPVARHHRRSARVDTVPPVAAPSASRQRRALKPRVRRQRTKNRRQKASPQRR